MNELVIFVDLQNDFLDMINDKFIGSINKLCKYLKLMNKNMIFIKFLKINERTIKTT